MVPNLLTPLSTRSRLRRALVTAVALCTALLVPISAASADPAPARVEQGLQVTDQSAPKPPVVPKRGKGDLTAAQGAWYGPYQLQVQHSGKCLDMGWQTHAGALAKQHTCQSGRTTQNWWVWAEEVPGYNMSYDYYYNAHSGQCLATTSSWQEYAQIQQRACDWWDDQVWVTYAGSPTNSWWLKQNYWSGLCLDVMNGGTADGTGIIQYGCHGGSTMRWQVRWP